MVMPIFASQPCRDLEGSVAAGMMLIVGFRTDCWKAPTELQA